MPPARLFLPLFLLSLVVGCASSPEIPEPGPWHARIVFPDEAMAFRHNNHPPPSCDWMTVSLDVTAEADVNDVRQVLLKHGPQPLASRCADLVSWCTGRDRFEAQGLAPSGSPWMQVCRLAEKCQAVENRRLVFVDGLRAEGVRTIHYEPGDRDLATVHFFEHLAEIAPRWHFFLEKIYSATKQEMELRCEASGAYLSALLWSGKTLLVSHPNRRAHVLYVMGQSPLSGADAVAMLEPATKAYKRLVEARILYANAVKNGGFVKLPKSTSRLKKNSKGKKVAALRKRLHQEGLLEREEGSRFDGELLKALRDFQFMHYLRVNGNLDGGTLRALNESATNKLARIDRALQAIRTAIPPWEADFVHVQAPHAFLELYQGGHFVKLFRTVIGSARKGIPTGSKRRQFMFRTLPLNSRIDRVVFNPEWKVPDSIAEREIVPALMEDPSYLEKHNYRVRTYSGGRELYIQESGPGNALGKVKFLFPNDYGYYLHDTPSKRLFKRTRRLFSHGCVRVQDALELAQYVLGHDQGISQEWIKRKLREREPRHVELKRPLPVHVTYQTAGADSNGRLFFAEDFYEMEEDLPH